MQPEIILHEGDVSIQLLREEGRGQVVDTRGISLIVVGRMSHELSSVSLSL
jgi:hypothetical protein